MKNIILSLAILFVVFNLSAQQNNHVLAQVNLTSDASETFTRPVLQERMVPAFPTDFGTFAEFLQNNLSYPEVAVEYAREGTVVVEVTVATDGTVSVVRVVKSLFQPLDEAAVAAAAKLPRFLPAVENGVAVDRNMMIPFKFSLR